MNVNYNWILVYAKIVGKNLPVISINLLSFVVYLVQQNLDIQNNVAIWEAEHGVAVPPGCVIHHLDWNKTNNSIENLICLTVKEHETVHNIKGKEYGYELLKTRVDGLPPM